MPDRDGYFLRPIWGSVTAHQPEVVDIDSEIDENSDWIYSQDEVGDDAALEARPASPRLSASPFPGWETLVSVNAKAAAGKAWTALYLAQHGHTVITHPGRNEGTLDELPEKDGALTRILKEVALLSGASTASPKQELDVTYCFRRLQGFMSDEQAEIWLDSDNERIGTRPLYALAAERVADVIIAMDAQETFVY